MPDMNDYLAIRAVVHAYARACDQRDWGMFDQVFSRDVKATYGGYGFEGREALVAIIRNSLGGCGPTQHQVSNLDVCFDGALVAHCRCYVRASHYGAGDQEGVFYDVWGEYIDTLEKRGEHWLIVRRQMLIHHEVGSRKVLAPAAGAS